MADQPPSHGRIAPLMLAASSQSRKEMAEATCSAVATEGGRHHPVNAQNSLLLGLSHRARIRPIMKR
jgi:hypothetical protein